MSRWTLPLSLLLTLALSACGGGGPTPTPGPEPEPEPPAPPPPPPPVEQVIVAGTASGYEGGDGTLRAEFFNTSAEVATAPIAANGTFSLQLPAEVLSSSLANSENFVFCEGGDVTLSSNTWSVDNFSSLEVEQAGSVTGQLLLSNASNLPDPESAEGFKNVDLWYSSVPLSVTGVCPPNAGGFGDTEVTFEIRLEKGWNYLLSEVTAAEGTTPSALSFNVVSEPPTDVQWDYLPPGTSFGNKVPGLKLQHIR